MGAGYPDDLMKELADGADTSYGRRWHASFLARKQLITLDPAAGGDALKVCPDCVLCMRCAHARARVCVCVHCASCCVAAGRAPRPRTEAAHRGRAPR
ncbi:hypothetical protein EON67_09075, partial [archaeon]